jgi:hypothetical protein
MFKLIGEIFTMFTELIYSLKPYIRTVKNVGEAVEIHSETFLLDARLGNEEKRAQLTKP